MLFHDSMSEHSFMMPLKGSHGHKQHGLTQLNTLSPLLNLNITIVTGSWTNTQLVSDYYSSLGYFKMIEMTDMHVKMEGTVSRISQVFNTTFFEYECETVSICFASTSEVFIPKNLTAAILGILGLEQVLTLKNNLVILVRYLNIE